MSCRKWLVRSLVFAVLGSLAVAGWLYQRWTDPAAVRRQVLAKLSSHFVGANVRLDGAYLRLLGGISVSELRLSRRDDPDAIDLAYVPSCIIFHDKEQLMGGRLSIRKVELDRPRIRIIRGKDGTWNVSGLMGPVEPENYVPTIVIRNGTFLVEDRLAAPGRAPVEINDVHLTIVNDPLPVLVIQGKALSDLAGPIQLNGTWQRVSSSAGIAIEAREVPIKPLLVQALAAYFPKLGEHARQLEGIARMHAEIGYHPGGSQPWSHDIRAQLIQGKLRHSQLPLALDQVEARARCIDGLLTLEGLTARSGLTRVELKGWARERPPAPGASAQKPIERMTPEPDSLVPDETDFQGELKVEHLPLTPDLFVRMPEGLQSINRDFTPYGPVSLAFTFSRKAGKWHKHCILQAEDVSATYVDFPYTAHHLKGTLEHLRDEGAGRDLLRVNLVGEANQRPVTIKGEVDGDGPRAGVQIDITANDVPIDKQLLDALPPEYQELAQKFHATGKGDAVASIRRPRGERKFQNRFVVRFRDAGICYEVFPYALESVTGVLDIQGRQWEFRDFQGMHKGALVRTSGRSEETPGGDRLTIEIRGTDIPLDADLEAALKPKLKEAWRVFKPGGTLSFVAHVDRAPGQPHDIDVTVNAQACSIRPVFFPYAFDEISAKVRYVRDWVHVTQVSGRHGDTQVTLDEARVYLKPSGGYWAELTNLRGNPIIPDADFLAALPPALRKGCETLKLQDPLALHTQLVIDGPSDPGANTVIYWDGGVAVRNASLNVGVPLEKVFGQCCCRGRFSGQHLEGVLGNIMLDRATLFGQPLTQIHSQLEVPREAPEVLRLPNLKAHVFGGNVGGEARVEFGPTLRYDLDLSALQVRLEEFGRHNFGNKAQMSGQASARLFLTGRGPGMDGLEGRGSIDVPSGRMYNLPVLLDLLKVIGLRPPDRTAFEEAHASFGIRGPRVHVTRLDLYGNAISLSGLGEMNLDGTDLQLDFYAVWGRIVQWLPPIIREVPPTISQYLLKIKMRGQVNNVQCTKEPVPVLVEPLERLLKQMRGKENDTREKEPARPVPPRDEPAVTSTRWPSWFASQRK